MKVTIISDIPLSRKNGTAVAAANLIESLRAKGHEVKVVCPDKNKKGKEGYYVAETRSFGPFDGYVKKNDVALAKADDDILYSAIDGADIVHCMMPFSLSRRAADIARALGIPVSAGFHCQAENVTNHLGLMNSKALNKAIYRRFYRVLYGKCDCVHYPTVFIKDEFESSVKKSTRGYVISNGVDEAFFKGERKARTDGKFVILCTGRYSREKVHGQVFPRKGPERAHRRGEKERARERYSTCVRRGGTYGERAQKKGGRTDQRARVRVFHQGRADGRHTLRRLIRAYRKGGDRGDFLP